LEKIEEGATVVPRVSVWSSLFTRNRFFNGDRRKCHPKCIKERRKVKEIA